MFDLTDNERLKVWRDFRQSVENSPTPLEDVAVFWSRTPFVNSFLNPLDPPSWPDPWQLILGNKFDNLAIVLGMLYTLKLTQKFKNSNFEIHMINNNVQEKYFALRVDDNVLNLEFRSIVSANYLESTPSYKIWQSVQEQ